MISIDVDEDEVKSALEGKGYIIFDSDAEIYDYVDNTLKAQLKEYVAEMNKNLYIYTVKNFKTYEEIYNDLRNLVEE